MPLYRAPVDDYRFLLHELFSIANQPDLPGHSELSVELVDDVLNGAATFCEDVLQPLNLPGDAEGCHFEDDHVRTPKGFKDAYKAFCVGGWPGLPLPAAYGGAGLPVSVAIAAAEMASSANPAFALYAGLTCAGASALIAHGLPWMKEHIAPKLVTGEWAGTMCLTEPGCGTDLRLMKTRAVEQSDGSYRMTGTKIFISGGDQDLTDNIMHLVIAKIPDADGHLADDLSAINFFLVPKLLISEDGTVGPRNRVSVGGIEKKMGIKAQATCVLNFDEAVAWRLGPKPAKGQGHSSAGMTGMFEMMNAARMTVGVQGIAAGEVAYQNAHAYVQERRAGRAPNGPIEPDKPADRLIVHPDIKRMLLHCRAGVEGARALAVWTTLQLAVAQSGRPEADNAAMIADLLTPVIKAYFTDLGFEAANLALQCYGGHGYIHDNGVEQFVRDARVNMLYEGANGVQAVDLVFRKLLRKSGANPLLQKIQSWLAEHDNKAMQTFTKPLERGLESLQQATQWLTQQTNRNDAAAAACDYLRLMGIVSVGWMWGQMAELAQSRLNATPANAEFYKAKLTAARYWMERVIPECPMLLERIRAGSSTIMDVT